MKVLRDHALISVSAASVVLNDAVVDHRIEKMEQSVAAFFEISKHQLNAWQHDTEAKLTICFLLCSKLNYSIGSVAKRYCINRLFLKQNIIKLYTKCLTDAAYMALIDRLATGANNTKVACKA